MPRPHYRIHQGHGTSLEESVYDVYGDEGMGPARNSVPWDLSLDKDLEIGEPYRQVQEVYRDGKR